MNFLSRIEGTESILRAREGFLVISSTNPSTLNLEGKGKTREEVVHEIMEKFGEKNPEVSVMHA